MSHHISLSVKQAISGIVQEVNLLGIKVVPDSSLNAQGKYAEYDPTKNTLVYDPGLVKDPALFLECLAHEATHALQAHKGNGSLEPLGIPPTASAVERVQKDKRYMNVPFWVRGVEFEAFTLEERPHVVLNMLRQCNGKSFMPYLMAR